jgi:hypothetical protein
LVPARERRHERLIPFQVIADATASVCASVDGWREGAHFHWESPYLVLTVGEDVAELISLFAMAQPYPPLGRRLRCEASVRGLEYSEDLQLEFWAQTPGGEFEELGNVQIKQLSPGEKASCSAEITPQEQGLYVITAYLYDDGRRIGRKVKRVYGTSS